MHTSLALNASFLFSSAPHKWWHAGDQESQNSHTLSHTDIQSAQEGTGAGGEPGVCSSSGWVFITCRSRGLSPLKAMKMLKIGKRISSHFHLCEREGKKTRLKDKHKQPQTSPQQNPPPNFCTDSCMYRFTHFILLHFIRVHPFSWDYVIIIWHALTHTHTGKHKQGIWSHKWSNVFVPAISPISERNYTLVTQMSELSASFRCVFY